MFDDEADMVPQEYWAAGPEETVPAIDAVLNHRLRNDTSQRFDGEVAGSETNLPTGKEITDPGRDDFEYYVSGNISNRSAIPQELKSDSSTDQMARQSPLPFHLGDQCCFGSLSRYTKTRELLPQDGSRGHSHEEWQGYSSRREREMEP